MLPKSGSYGTTVGGCCNCRPARHWTSSLNAHSLSSCLAEASRMLPRSIDCSLWGRLEIGVGLPVYGVGIRRPGGCPFQTCERRSRCKHPSAAKAASIRDAVRHASCICKQYPDIGVADRRHRRFETSHLSYQTGSLPDGCCISSRSFAFWGPGTRAGRALLPSVF